MGDFSIEWTSEVLDCSYTCVIKEEGCEKSYAGFFLSTVGNTINGVQNEVAGWAESVCLKCTDSSGATLLKDKIALSQNPKKCYNKM